MLLTLPVNYTLGWPVSRNRGMKAVGFSTQTFTEADTGLQLAAVYVPTTPNPTSGYLEIVHQEGVVSLDRGVDGAMTFTISGARCHPLASTTVCTPPVPRRGPGGHPPSGPSPRRD